MQAYSDPTREPEPYALPDLEVWEDRLIVAECRHCGETDIPLPESHVRAALPDEPGCQHCGGALTPVNLDGPFQWWGWHCFPGCLPDSDLHGPYDTESELVANLRGES